MRQMRPRRLRSHCNPLSKSKSFKPKTKNTSELHRIKHLLADKSHFLHEAKETGKQKRSQAREQKREIINSLTRPQSPEHHQWAAKGTAMQCLQCKARLTMHSNLQDIKDGKDAKCDQATGHSLVGGAASITAKAELIQQMLEGTMPNMAPHQLILKNHYIVCETCNVRLLKNSAQEKLKELSSKTCWNQAWSGGPTWTGHGSHKIWRKGGKIWCQTCQAHANMTEAGPMASKASSRLVRRLDSKACHTCFDQRSSELEQKEKNRRKNIHTYMHTYIHTYIHTH